MKDLSQRSEAACAQSVSEVMQHWSVSDQRLPCGLCESCRVAVRRADTDPTVLRTLAVLRLDSMYASQTTKRQSADSVCPGATCVVCQSRPRNQQRVAPEHPQSKLSVVSVADDDVKDMGVTSATLSHSFMFNVQQELGLSDRMTLRLAAMLRSQLGPKIVAPNLDRKMTQRNMVLQDLFTQVVISTIIQPCSALTVRNCWHV